MVRLGYLCAEAVADCTNLLDAVLLLEGLDGLLDDGVDGLLGVGVLAVGALLDPGHDVLAAEAAEGDGVAVEEVRHEGQVAVGGELVGDQLGVLPDAEHVGQVEDGGVLVRLALGRGGEVGVVAADLDGLAAGLASGGDGGQRSVVMGGLDLRNAR